LVSVIALLHADVDPAITADSDVTIVETSVAVVGVAVVAFLLVPRAVDVHEAITTQGKLAGTQAAVVVKAVSVVALLTRVDLTVSTSPSAILAWRAIRVELVNQTIAIVVEAIVAGNLEAGLRRVRIREGLAATGIPADERVALGQRAEVPVIGAGHWRGGTARNGIAEGHLTSSGRALGGEVYFLAAASGVLAVSGPTGVALRTVGIVRAAAGNGVAGAGPSAADIFLRARIAVVTTSACSSDSAPGYAARRSWLSVETT
jgi:hypothetical protein